MNINPHKDHAQELPVLNLRGCYDPREIPVGGLGFLVKIEPAGAVTRVDFQSYPGRKNLSHQLCLKGWLGNTNGVNRTALGLATVVQRREYQEEDYWEGTVETRTKRLFVQPLPVSDWQGEIEAEVEAGRLSEDDASDFIAVIPQE